MSSPNQRSQRSIAAIQLPVEIITTSGLAKHTEHHLHIYPAQVVYFALCILPCMSQTALSRKLPGSCNIHVRLCDTTRSMQGMCLCKHVYILRRCKTTDARHVEPQQAATTLPITIMLLVAGVAPFSTQEELSQHKVTGNIPQCSCSTSALL